MGTHADVDVWPNSHAYNVRCTLTSQMKFASHVVLRIDTLVYVFLNSHCQLKEHYHQ